MEIITATGTATILDPRGEKGRVNAEECNMMY